MYRESDLSNRGYFLIAQELVYQWLGSYITPNWWTDAHVNKAIAGFLASSTAIEVTASKILKLIHIYIYFAYLDRSRS